MVEQLKKPWCIYTTHARSGKGPLWANMGKVALAVSEKAECETV